MALYLQERYNAEQTQSESLLPSAQLLLLLYIYSGKKELSFQEATKALGFTPTSIVRASKQLETLGYLKTKKIGVQKILHSEEKPKELFQRIKEILPSPVKRIKYIPVGLVEATWHKSGYSALAEYSMLNDPDVACYAVTDSSILKASTNTLYDSKRQVAVELWRYDPKKLAKQNAVDVLSLALALRDDPDERVEEAVKEMLNALWLNQ